MSVTITVNQSTPSRRTIGRRGVVSVDPLVREIPAQNLRVGKQLLTPDGWQTILGFLMVEETDQVDVFTDERDDEDGGWNLHFGDLVQTRLTPTAEQQHRQRVQARRETRRQRRLAMAAANCPQWCVEHYDGGPVGDERNHSSEPLTALGRDADTGEPKEFGFWLEQRDKPAGGPEKVIVLETRPHTGDIELRTGEAHAFAAAVMSLADRAEHPRQ